MSDSDRIAKMMARQREREEAMRKKEEEKNLLAQQKKNEQNQAYLAKNPTAAAKKVDEPAKPTDNSILMKINLYAPLPPTTRGKPTIISGDPSGENFIYCLGSNVFIRNIENPLIADIYTEHSYATTVARYSPDRKYIASGDSTGTVRIWHTQMIQAVPHKLVLEKKALGGPVADLDWDPESKRIIVVGQGREKFGVLFFAENGASAGDITGHAKPITTCSIRPSKPYRIITGAEDFECNWFEGPPFKLKHSFKNFSNFINCARFSPDGKQFLITAQDKKGFFGDAETGTITFPLDPASAHTGGIYACSYSPDSQKVLTVSGDKTAKVWDTQTGKCLETHTFGTDVEDQLVGCLWQGTHRIVLSLNGHIYYLGQNSGDAPARVIQGHNKNIEAVTYDASTKSVYTASYDGVISKWSLETGDVKNIEGKGHTNAVKRLAIQNGQLISVSQDDTLRSTPLNGPYGSSFVGLDAPPTGLAVSASQPNLIVVTTIKNLLVIRDLKVVSKTAILSPTAVALSPSGDLIAVGNEANKIILFSLRGDEVKQESVLDSHRSPLTRLDFTSDGKWLASGDRTNKIIIWNVSTKSEHITDWLFHTARIDALSWHRDNRHLLSAGLDQQIIVWDLENPKERIMIRGAHQGGINDALWIDDTTVATVGQDVTLRTWKVLN